MDNIIVSLFIFIQLLYKWAGRFYTGLYVERGIQNQELFSASFLFIFELVQLVQMCCL